MRSDKIHNISMRVPVFERFLAIRRQGRVFDYTTTYTLELNELIIMFNTVAQCLSRITRDTKYMVLFKINSR